jgi:two-component system, NarL family, nitrate/nitrite response regulator NarL
MRRNQDKPNGVAKQRIRLLLVDDHPVIHDALQHAFSCNTGFHVVGSALDGLQAIRLIKKTQPDVIVMDVRMPHLPGAEATSLLLEHFPNVKIIAFSGIDDRKTVSAMVHAGVRGYVVKGGACEDLLRAIEIVHQGGLFFSRSIAKWATHPRHRKQLDAESSSNELTTQELRILELIAGGRSNKEMATTLKLSVRTVEKHRETLTAKLNLHGVAELTKYAIREGITSVD